MNITVPATRAQRRLLDAQSNALLQTLMTAESPAAIDAWIIANVNTVSDARRMLAALALGLRALYQGGQ